MDPEGETDWATKKDLNLVWADSAVKGLGIGKEHTIAIESNNRKIRDFPQNHLPFMPYDEDDIIHNLTNNEETLKQYSNYILNILDNADEVYGYFTNNPIILDENHYKGLPEPEAEALTEANKKEKERKEKRKKSEAAIKEEKEEKKQILEAPKTEKENENEKEKAEEEKEIKRISAPSVKNEKVEEEKKEGLESRVETKEKDTGSKRVLTEAEHDQLNTVLQSIHIARQLQIY